ncbi:MAG TPA: response regulator [Flavisolibacter sp.]|nr:response regulator [Flavisolibacter sp.]
MSQSTSKILYVDDDSDDCYFLGLSLSETGTNADLVCATDVEEAINYLNSADANNLPSLIILDLNMPKWDGRQTLSYIKSQPRLCNIPVVILSTSENKLDQEACTVLGASSYYKKPFHYEGYKMIINSFMPLLGIS